MKGAAIMCAGFRYFINPVETVKKIMSHYIKEGQIAVDATVGNGWDTLLLAELVGDGGRVYGFDIQGLAIEITQEKLLANNLDDRVVLINDGHENVDKYIDEEVNFVVYNLGYLPGGDKDIKTNTITTLESVEKMLGLLING